MKVGVRELKAHLSEYLDRAAGGESIEVTERGRPKARLGPVGPVTTLRLPLGYPPPPEVQARIDAEIQRGIREGWITPGNGKPPNFDYPLVKPIRPSQEILDEDRGA